MPINPEEVRYIDSMICGVVLFDGKYEVVIGGKIVDSTPKIGDAIQTMATKMTERLDK